VLFTFSHPVRNIQLKICSCRKKNGKIVLKSEKAQKRRRKHWNRKTILKARQANLELETEENVGAESIAEPMFQLVLESPSQKRVFNPNLTRQPRPQGQLLPRNHPMCQTEGRAVVEFLICRMVHSPKFELFNVKFRNLS
jgi:hypothetical protein